MTASRRVACLLVSDLVVQAELRAHPELLGHAFVVASGDEGRDEVIAASPEATRANVCTGQSVAHARAACSGLIVRTASPARERTARQSLLDAALSLSPRAELAERSAAPFAAEVAVFLDASGIDTLFESERHFASTLLAHAEAIGLAAVAGVASSRFAAHGLARRLATQPADTTLQALSPSEEAAALAALPIDLLAPDDALAARLTRFGIYCVRDLLALPRTALAQRLGSEAVRLAARARGEEIEPPLPEPRDRRLEEASDLEHAIGQLEPLLFVVRGMLSRLVERLEVRGLAARHLDLELELEGGGRDARRTGLSSPTLDLRVWLRVLALELESNPPRAAIVGISIVTEGSAQRGDQLDLFRPRGPSPGALDRTLAELEALCGSDRVGAPRVADEHRPDAYERGPFELARVRDEPARPDGGHAPPGSLAVRALRPPARAEIRVEAGTPVHIRSAITRGRIVTISGPWRTTGGWWSEEGRYALDHYDIQVSDGIVARLCFDWVEHSWRIDALYD
ncbi:MAG: DNA polymerase Y family protein [Myxococcota bacterium]|nr:DNA polymerase Y family protein [Myxococcota bacterium]